MDTQQLKASGYRPPTAVAAHYRYRVDVRGGQSPGFLITFSPLQAGQVMTLDELGVGTPGALWGY